MSNKFFDKVNEIKKDVFTKLAKTQKSHFERWEKKVKDFYKMEIDNLHKLEVVYNNFITSLKEKNTRINKEIKSKIIDNLTNTYESMKNKFMIRKLENEKTKNEKLEKDLNETKKELENFTKIKNHLTEKAKELEKTLKEKKEAQKYLEIKEEKLVETENNVDQLNNEIEQLKSVVENKVSELQTYSDKADNLNKLLTEKESEIEKLKQDLELEKEKVRKRDETFNNFNFDREQLKSLINNSYNEIINLIKFVDDIKESYEYYENEILEKYKLDISNNRNEYFKQLSDICLSEINKNREENGVNKLYMHYDKTINCIKHSRHCSEIDAVEMIPDNYKDGDDLLTLKIKVVSDINIVAGELLNNLKENISNIYENDWTHIALGFDFSKNLNDIFVTFRLSKV